MHSTRILVSLTIAAVLSLPATAQIALDDLIAKHIQARGGMEKMKAVKTVKITAKQSAQGMELPVVIQLKRPSQARIDVTIQGKTLVQGYDGKNGWMINPFEGAQDAQKMPDEEVKELEQESDMDGPLVDHKAKGHTVELIGKEDLEGTPVYKLKLVLKNGEVRYEYIDAESFLGLRTTQKRKRQGAEIEMDTYAGDYKEVGGLMFPHALETKFQGQTVSSIVIEKVEMNPAMDASIFKMPAAKPGEKAASGAPPAAKPDAGTAAEKPPAKTQEKPPAEPEKKP